MPDQTTTPAPCQNRSLVNLKPYIEQRSMDCGQIEDAMKAMAFWKGLLYDRKALEIALQTVPRLTGEEFNALRGEVARYVAQHGKAG